MQATDIPVKFPKAFAAAAGSGFVRTIPVASQIPITPGAASLTDGFPPLNFLPVGSGGIPPFGEDMNGILRQITQWVVWGNAGGTVVFDATFAAAIGGYPAGAFLRATSGVGAFWISTADNNSTDPDAGGAGWQALVIQASVDDPKIDGVAAAGASLKYAREDHVHPTEWCGLSTGAANAQVIAAPETLASITDGQFLRFRAGFTNTGAATLQITGIGTFALRRRGPAGEAVLTGGEIVAGENVTVSCDGVHLQIESIAQGSAAGQNASSPTGTVSAVSGAITAGNIPIFSDTLGTVIDSGATPGSLAGSAQSVYYVLGLSN